MNTAAKFQDLTDLPPTILARLAAEGVATFADWRALGPRRHQLFGIVPSVVRQIDALARLSVSPSAVVSRT